MPKFRATKYIRLSYTDDRRTESDSVGNQRKLIDDFVSKNPDIEIVSERIDDGYSGTIFDRPAFKEMMQDVMEGSINCIIVKDLSRLGREYIETGRYLRRVFPSYGVRFIAITDGIDTAHDACADDLALSVKNIMNEAYARDISVKTRAALRVKRRNGDFVGSFTVYGYMKSETDRNQLVPDPYASRVVQDIFRMRLDGLSANKIAGELNRLGILSPMVYKKNHGIPYARRGWSADKDDCKWSATTIIRILQDEVYIGTLVQGKQGSPHFKIKEMEQLPSSAWIRVPDAHEPIISRDSFELVQRIKGLDTRSAPDQNGVYMFSGLLICGCCGGKMIRKTNKVGEKTYHYYYCPTGKKNGCTHPTMLKEDTLAACVLNLLKAHIGNLASLEALLAGIDQDSINQALVKEYREHIAENEQTLANSIETGYFIERVFPLFHTRFIAIGDGFDTDEHRGDTGGLEVAFKYLINEQYSRDMSIKCKSAKYAKMRRGEYQSKECIFGYRKGADGKLEPDPDQAPVVRLIFELAASGMGFTAIAAELTKRRIPTPGEVKAAKGNGTYDVSRCNGRWNTSTVTRILDDERFLGHYVQGVRTVTEIGGHQIRKKAKDKWFFVPDQHEPIVDQELFDKAHEGQIRFNLKNKKARNTPLCGKVICGCCHHALSYYPKKEPVYVCRVSRMDETLACYGFQIPVSDVLEAVFNVVRQQLMAAAPVTTDGDPALSLADVHQQQYEDQIAEIMESKRLLYEQLIAGEIEADAFQQGKSSLDEMLAKTKSTFAAIRAKAEEKQTAENRQQQRRRILADMQAEGTFSNELAEQIIDRILIYPDKRIEIIYKIADLFA